MSNIVAPEGQVWVCFACGKRSRDRHGEAPLDSGWDVSCTINCVLCYEDKIVVGGDGRVTKVKDGGVVSPPPD